MPPYVSCAAGSTLVHLVALRIPRRQTADSARRPPSIAAAVSAARRRVRIWSTSAGAPAPSWRPTSRCSRRGSGNPAAAYGNHPAPRGTSSFPPWCPAALMRCMPAGDDPATAASAPARRSRSTDDSCAIAPSKPPAAGSRTCEVPEIRVAAIILCRRSTRSMMNVVSRHARRTVRPSAARVPPPDPASGCPAAGVRGHRRRPATSVICRT